MSLIDAAGIVTAATEQAEAERVSVLWWVVPTMAFWAAVAWWVFL